jgi:ketosteroid isomerase-like protein
LAKAYISSVAVDTEMHMEQSPEGIRQIAMKFDNAIEARDVERVVSAFTDDCEIELLGITLKGREGARRWIEWLLDNIPEVRFEPVTIMVEGNVFFEEFVVTVKRSDGSKLESKQAEVLVYEDHMIKSLRLYFDRLDFSDLIAGNIVSRKIVHSVKSRSLKGLL